MRLRELTVVLAEEILDLLVLDGLQFSGDLECIEEQGDVDRRVRRGGDVVGVQGDDLRGLAVVEEGKVVGPESGYGTARRIGNDDIDVEEAFGLREGGCRRLRARGFLACLRGRGLRVGANEKGESDEKELAGRGHSFLCVISRARMARQRRDRHLALSGAVWWWYVSGGKKSHRDWWGGCGALVEGFEEAFEKEFLAAEDSSVGHGDGEPGAAIDFGDFDHGGRCAGATRRGRCC